MSELAPSSNPLANDSTKSSKEFGLQTIKDIYFRWKSGFGKESWDQRVKRFEYNRSFARGKQPMEEYKDIINADGELAFINLDYSPLPIAVPFINRLKDRYNQRIEKITCSSIDPFTQNKKKKAKDDALFKLKYKEQIMQLQQEAGAQLEEFSDNDPQDEQELDIEFGFNYKVREEVVMQNLIDIVFYDNKMSKVEKDMIFNHIINCGYAITKTYIDGSGRIKIRIVKPDNFITSYSEWNDLRDWEYHGEAYYKQITEVRLQYPGKIKEEELYELAKSNSGKFGNPNWKDNWSYTEGMAQPYDSFRVPVVDLVYKALHNLTYEKKVDRFGKEILDKSKKEKVGKEYEKSEPYYVSYTGCWIVDTDYLLEWGLSKHMIKPEKNLTEIYSPYSVYLYDNNQMTNTPMIETMIPSIKMMQLLSLQTQKLIATTAPDGSNIDVTGLSDIDMGEGVGIVSPQQLYSIYLQTGNSYFKSKEDGEAGEGQRQPPITQSSKPFSNKLEQLENQWQAEYQKLVMIVGSNSLAQGQITNQAVGAKVLQDARQLGESASNYVYNSYLNILENTAKLVMMLGWDILFYGHKGKKGYDGYRLALGDEKIEYLKVEATDDFEKTQFDVKIEAVIDDTEQQLLEQNIQAAVAADPEFLRDAIDIRLIAKTNIKYASYMLASRMRKRRKQAMEEAAANAQANTEQAVIAAQAKAKGEADLEILKAQLASQGRKEELEFQRELEAIKYFGIAKAKIIDGVLSKEGSTVNDLPAFTVEGMDIVTKTQTEMIVDEMNDAEREEQMAEQQAAEEQAMAEQQQMEQGMQQQQVA